MRILQAGILKWVTMPCSRWYSQPRGWTQVSCIAGGLFTTWATREVGWKTEILVNKLQDSVESSITRNCSAQNVNRAEFQKLAHTKKTPDPQRTSTCTKPDIVTVGLLSQFLIKIESLKNIYIKTKLIRFDSGTCLSNGICIGKESAYQCRRCKRLGFDPWVGKIPQRARQPTPVFLLGESHQRSLGGYGPWGYKELDTTEAIEHAHTPPVPGMVPWT